MVIRKEENKVDWTSKGGVLTSVSDHTPFDAVVMSNFVINRSRVVGSRGATPTFSPLVRVITLVSVRSSIWLVIRVPIFIIVLSLASTRSVVIRRIESSIRHERTATSTMKNSSEMGRLVHRLSNRPKPKRDGTLGIGALRWPLEVSFIRQPQRTNKPTDITIRSP